MTDESTIADGRQAWASIQRATSFASWRAVALAVAVGRRHALHVAGVNRPYGARYGRAIVAWLTANGFADLPSGTRTALCIVADNLPAIEQWLAALPAERRATLNHPQVIVRNFRKNLEPEMPRRSYVTNTNGKAAGNLTYRHGKAVHFPQDMIQRAAEAVFVTQSNDTILVGLAVLKAAIRGHDDVAALLDPPKPPQRARQSEPAQIGAAP